MSTPTLPHDIDLKPVSEMCAVIRGRHTHRFTVRSPLPAAPRNTWFTLKTHSREFSGAIHLWNCRENKQKEIILIGRVITNTMSGVCPSTDTIKKRLKKKKSEMGLYIFWLLLSKHCPAKSRQDSLTWKRVSFITGRGNDLCLWKCGCGEILMAPVALTIISWLAKWPRTILAIK